MGVNWMKNTHMPMTTHVKLQSPCAPLTVEIIL